MPAWPAIVKAPKLNAYDNLCVRFVSKPEIRHEWIRLFSELIWILVLTPSAIKTERLQFNMDT